MKCTNKFNICIFKHSIEGNYKNKVIMKIENILNNISCCGIDDIVLEQASLPKLLHPGPSKINNYKYGNSSTVKCRYLLTNCILTLYLQ